MDYRERLTEIFGLGKGPISLRTIFDCDSEEWNKTTKEKKVFFLQKMIESGYPLENWIEEYKEQYQKTHPHIIGAISKSIEFISNQTNKTSETILSFLEGYIPKIDSYLNSYSDFKMLDLSDLAIINFEYIKNDRGLDFVDSLRKHLNSVNIHDSEYIVKFWIINKWGGISSFKDNNQKSNRNNRAKIDAFLEKTNFRKPLTKSIFEVISSLSKIASFHNHKDFFVYDSRVIYALNWIILNSKIEKQKFFPMPQGRNAKLALFDLDTIVKLIHKNNFEKLESEILYYSYKDAYYIYCDLIKVLAEKLIPNRQPYHLEMLLFSLTDDIYEDIRKSVNISIS